MKKIYKIEVDCANCANLMEQAVQKVAGVSSATIHYMTLKLHIVFEEGYDPSTVMKEVLRVCKKIEPDCNIFF